jgi:hypothetical protein
MWRVLEVGEVIEDGDEYHPNFGNWIPVGMFEGERVTETNVPHRRKIPDISEEKQNDNQQTHFAIFLAEKYREETRGNHIYKIVMDDFLEWVEKQQNAS